MAEFFDSNQKTRDPQPGDTLILWLPLFMMAGTGLYFALDREPEAWWFPGGLVATIVAGAVSLRWRDRTIWRWSLAALLAFFLGAGLAQMRTQGIGTVLLNKSVWTAEVTGTIQSFERAGQGWSVVLSDAHIGQGRQGKQGRQAYTLRLSFRPKGFVPELGGVVTVKSSLMPPSPPFVPGGFDFRQNAFFKGLSSYGYVTKLIRYQPPARAAQDRLENYRDWLTEQVYAQTVQPVAGVTAALLNGQRAGIDNKTNKVLQQSGLFHIISISGVHVGLLAIIVFWIVRFLLVLNMRLALTWPVKKIAAVCALGAIIFYLLVVGSSPPTLRSVLMTGAALVALLVDRQGIQLRIIALAALCILCVQPESVQDIGFQLSFCAVIGLVAFYQETRGWWVAEFWNDGVHLKALRALAMTVVTSLVATCVTAPLVLLHFQQIPALSILSNLLATPVVAFIIMPGTFLSYLLTPFPVLGALAIKFIGFGVALLLDIAQLIAKMPVSVWHAPPLAPWVVVVFLFGVFLVITVKSRWRWGGLGVAAAALLAVPFDVQPDFVLTPSRIVAQVTDEAVLIEGRTGKFERNFLLQWAGRQEAKPFPCAEDICRFQVKGKNIALVRSVAALDHACDAQADLVLTRYYLDRPCASGVVVDRHGLDKRGAQAVFIGDKIEVRAAHEASFARKWR